MDNDNVVNDDDHIFFFDDDHIIYENFHLLPSGFGSVGARAVVKTDFGLGSKGLALGAKQWPEGQRPTRLQVETHPLAHHG